MKFYFSPFIFSLLILTISSMDVYAQEVSKMEFDEYLAEAWEEIQNSEFENKIQNEHANKFFSYYLNNSGTESADKAIIQSFILWGNTGNAPMVDSAIVYLDDHSEVWESAIDHIGNAYYQSPGYGTDQFIEFLHNKKEKLKNEYARSSVLLNLIKNYHSQKGEDDKVIELVRELIKLDAKDFYTEQALGYLYELETLKIGESAPYFTINSHEDIPVSLSAYKDKIVILDFWATWCSPCIPEIPHLKSLRESYSEDDLVIIGIALEEKNDKFLKFMEKKGIEWPQINQKKQWKDDLTQLYNITGIPQKYIIGRDGKIVAKNLRGEALKEKIKELFEE